MKPSVMLAPKPIEKKHAECKESQFYSLLFGQAAASIYWPKNHLHLPEKVQDSLAQ